VLYEEQILFIQNIAQEHCSQREDWSLWYATHNSRPSSRHSLFSHICWLSPEALML